MDFLRILIERQLCSCLILLWLLKNLVTVRTGNVYHLTYYMEQSPTWEANWFSAGQETPRILWNPKVHYRIHKYPTPVPILSQLDPVHTSTSHFLKIFLNIILPPTPGSPKRSLSNSFPHQNPVYASLLPPYVLHTQPIEFFSILSNVYHLVTKILPAVLVGNNKYSHSVKGIKCVFENKELQQHLWIICFLPSS